MKTLKLTLLAAALCCGFSAQAQTNSPFIQFVYDIKAFMTDTTNIFNTGTVAVEAGPVFGFAKMRFGADADIQFPIAQQASVGLDLLYFDGRAYNGVVNTTLGTTWTLPWINQPVYTYAQVGVGTDLQNPNNVINEEWAGAKWKYQFGGSFTNLSLTLKGAVGHLSNEQGALVKGMAGLEWRFR
jgi:hypothetical protein